MGGVGWRRWNVMHLRPGIPSHRRYSYVLMYLPLVTFSGGSDTENTSSYIYNFIYGVCLKYWEKLETSVITTKRLEKGDFKTIYVGKQWAGIAQSVQRLATGWTVWGSNHGAGEVFRTRPNRSWGPPNLLYNGNWAFPGGKAAEAWHWPPTPI